MKVVFESLEAVFAEPLTLIVIVIVAFVVLLLVFLALLRYSNKSLVERMQSLKHSNADGLAKRLETRVSKFKGKAIVVERKLNSLEKRIEKLEICEEKLEPLAALVKGKKT